MADSKRFRITDAHLSLDALEEVLNNPERQLELSDSAKAAVLKCRNYLDERMQRDDSPIYGINTGFGSLCDTKIESADLEALQDNLIRSHSCGTGSEVPPEIVRLMLLLKVKSISFGHSGVSLEATERLLDFYNRGVTPVVYTQGSLGASGDLAPLAHLCLPLIGEGKVRIKGGPVVQTSEVLDEKPLKLRSKEGLGLLNGTQFMLSYAITAFLKARRLSRAADKIAALSLDAFDGRLDPFQPQLHAIRGHTGQGQTAKAIRELLADSEIAAAHKIAVQDPYSFRCVPQVHGASKDALSYCENVFLTEANSTTDNPNIFVDDDLILSGGNFHGQPLALALDFMSMALAEFGSISERRVFQLLSGSRGLPPFLVANPGLHSGLMIAQYTAASIVSQNKQLATPAVVDTIPSSNGQEDHVSMGANGAVKCYQILENLQTLLGIELMTASQALWFRRPSKTGSGLQTMLEAFREEVPPVEKDRILHDDIVAASQFVGQHL